MKKCLIVLMSIAGVSYRSYSMDMPQWQKVGTKMPVVELSVYNAQKDKIGVIYKISNVSEMAPLVIQPLENSSAIIGQKGVNSFELKNTTDHYAVATQEGVFEIGLTDKHTGFTSWWPYNHQVGKYIIPLEQRNFTLEHEKQKFIILITNAGKPLLTPVSS